MEGKEEDDNPKWNNPPYIEWYWISERDAFYVLSKVRSFVSCALNLCITLIPFIPYKSISCIASNLSITLMRLFESDVCDILWFWSFLPLTCHKIFYNKLVLTLRIVWHHLQAATQHLMDFLAQFFKWDDLVPLLICLLEWVAN
jgi:hypothetical protein